MYDFLEVDSIYHNINSSLTLNDIYIKCNYGQTVGIIGRNGCGKSTLLNIIFGSIKVRDKHVRINSNLIKKPYNYISLLPQEHFLPLQCKVSTIISLLFNKSSIEAIISNKFIKTHLNTKIKFLSRGELKYLELILILNLKSKFILLDSPFDYLSPKTIDIVKSLILNSKKGIIISESNPNNIYDICDSIYHLNNGSLKKMI
ncbi:ATP-binding cassette domain-containing protein [Empedobacter sp.]|uniref:ATP-binding cassette domain-containing protein n=1 Tax=Empedobacter sp. TaxID=1927715 RepID=UPI0028AB7739|nr:ATP-binding cassette domain-containing protein [Empedobacter sp.]